MNLTLNNLNIAAGAASTAPGTPASASAAGAANDALAGLPLALDAAGAEIAVAQPALAFAQWLGLEQGVPAAAVDAAVPAQETTPPAAEAPAEEQESAADNVLLGAMSMAMPMMPVAQATLAAVAAALPGVPAAKEPAPAADTDVSLPAAGGSRAAAPAVSLVASTLSPAVAPVQAAPVQAGATPVASGTTAGGSAGGAAVALGDAPAAKEGAQDQATASVAERAPAGFGVSAPATGGAQRGNDTVALSGPPTAWRQTLQEALGDRLQLQVGKGAEQAVIKLEPPMLGRVEIAIRHTAGSLEVHISATHNEVLRQLQNVSENLRNDLAQRQFTDVAVNVAPAPRSANATPQFAGDGGNRGRQQDGREQEQTPGNALGEANTGASPFSLNGRA